ncbi:MAG: Tyrosine--tRNA ligase [Patescibacteria group bacterium]|nr:Tyrosine--tRNA ligase [Patescibacteria group bacterium]
MSTVICDPARVDWFLDRAVSTVLPTREQLRELLLSGKRLRVYLGVDPTGPTIHIGHAVAVQKLAELQDLGHEVIFLMGNFTAMIGDPTDKGAARKRLTKDEVLQNLQAYKSQLARLIRLEGENAAQIRFNADWLEAMSFADVVELASHFTVQQMSERDMFEKRLQEGKPVYLHEFLYPLMQGYDSVALEVDLEIGGNDQVFNMLAGRTLLREMKGREKFVMACKLLADPTGKKMGKSEGNMIALADTPEDAYGKIMSWTDEMILPGFEILTQASAEEVADIRARLDGGENPLILKKELALRVVTWCFGADAAEKAAEHFAQVHQQGELPQEIAEYVTSEAEMALMDALVFTGLVDSKSEARRQIEQSAVRVNGELAQDSKQVIVLGDEPVLVQKGKRGFASLRRA